ncbi:glycosyltransferase family 2 protein [Lutibaculum baratangense]|uniref:Putative N-acetylgalactosaminyl-diphosphoundecaprenol glucuronosyltransferase n=1 Tax=Lutibaculum baratangense AMV1 TaxID=631454 RepID=V4RIF5_9HYPH|nr:glycosyltransferase family A protein [Lutibaculum baratangense]ESR23065.1 putative N-acetylgalactosaminyl-diphosphoundecaprenol glucuronosyltransferase [Lutibaculum baratangense AMV1]
MEPAVSVILPTYNRLDSLAAAMESVLSQSFRDIELIVVDDGSPQDVRAAVAGIGDHRVIYHRRARNGGAGAARNSGLEIARGRFIAFQDSDDLWLPGKLERQMHLFTQLPARVGAVTGGKLLYGRSPSFRYGKGLVAYAPALENRLHLGDDQVRRMLVENRISLQNTLFRRDCHPTSTWFDPLARANEDWDFAVRLCRHTLIYEDDRPVVVGFISTDSISSDPRRECSGLLRIMRKNRDVIEADGDVRGRLEFDLARLLWKCGHTKRARAFMARALRSKPALSLALATSLLRGLRAGVARRDRRHATGQREPLASAARRA